MEHRTQRILDGSGQIPIMRNRWIGTFCRLWVLSLYLAYCYCLTNIVLCTKGRSNGITLGGNDVFSNAKCRASVPGCNAQILFASKSQLPSFALNDSQQELESIRSWKSTSATAKEAKIVYRAPSLLDTDAFLEVKQRIHGWHTLGIVGGPTKSIYHGVFRKDEKTGIVDPYALGPSEYIRTMASVALCLSSTVEKSSLQHRESVSNKSAKSSHTPLRFLHMGYGSGSLMRFLRSSIPNSQHTAIDLDPTVVKAAADIGLLDTSSPDEVLLVGDALEYAGPNSSELPTRFHGVCIDVFDGANLMPTGFYSIPFLENLRDNVLERDGCTYVIHNFHVGTDSLAGQLEDAMNSYRTVFGSISTESPTGMERSDNTDLQRDILHHSLYLVDSLNTNNHGGNTILIAILNCSGNEEATDTHIWHEMAALATEQWKEKRFDVARRVKDARPF